MKNLYDELIITYPISKKWIKLVNSFIDKVSIILIKYHY